MSVKDLLAFLDKNPKSIFILLTVLFGYGYYEQNNQLQGMLIEVGGLRVEMSKMNEIIKLKTELAKKECYDVHAN